MQIVINSPKMLKLCSAVFCWYLIVCEATTTRIQEKNNLTMTSFLDKFKQHDYKGIFERMELVRYDKRYMESINVVTYKYNRTTPLANISQLNFKQDVGNHLEGIIQAYKFASNEYRLFPMRFQINFCQALNKNIAGIANFIGCGNISGCPLLKGRNYTICNWAPDSTKFPPFVPSGQYKIEVEFHYGSIELFVLDGYGSVSRPIT